MQEKVGLLQRIQEGLFIPKPNDKENQYSGRITLRTPKSLHRTLAKKAEEEGVSLNQYLLYIVSQNVKESSR